MRIIDNYISQFKTAKVLSNEIKHIKSPQMPELTMHCSNLQHDSAEFKS